MTADLLSTLAARKQRWLDLYDFFRPASPLLVVDFITELGPRPWPRQDNFPQRLEWAWRKYRLQLDQLTWLEDDKLPYLDVYTGTEIFAAAFGCRVQYPENDMPFALPLIHSAAEVSQVEIPGLDSPYIAPLFDLAEELRRRAGSSALLHMVDIQSPMDIAALIWEKTSFYPALLEAPEAVLELAHKVKTFQVRFFTEWFARFGRDYIAHYPDYYMPAGVTLSEDEVGAVSPALFERLFLPELVDLSNRFGGLGMHCCATARHQWANFRKIPHLRLLNLNQPGPVALEGEAYFADLCAQLPVYQDVPTDWALTVPHPPRARLVFQISAASRGEALDIVRRFRLLYRK
jgi:hypothetical protein